MKRIIFKLLTLLFLVSVTQIGMTGSYFSATATIEGNTISTGTWEEDEGCTLSKGYWMTSSKYGPAPYDDTWALILPDGEDTVFFHSGQTYYEVLWTEPAGGNAYYILAHQYIAAWLNGLKGADLSVVQSDLDTATGFFNNPINTPTFIGGLTGGDPLRQQFLDLAATLDSYNNGDIGPGYCLSE